MENRKILYTKKVLSETLITLLKNKVITDISVVEVCRVADVNRTTFYKYFLDIPDLLSNIENDFMEKLRRMLESIPKNQINQSVPVTIENIFVFIKTNQFYIEVLMSEKGNVNFQRKLIELIYRYVGISNEPSLSESGIKYVYVIQGSLAIIQLWIKNNFDAPPQKLASILYEMSNKILR